MLFCFCYQETLVKHQCGISVIYKVKQNAVFWGGSALSFSMI